MSLRTVNQKSPLRKLTKPQTFKIICLSLLVTSNDNTGAAASCLHNTLEAGELWSSKPCHCIPTGCGFPTRLRIVTDGVGALGDVVEGIGILVEKRIDEAKSLAAT